MENIKIIEEDIEQPEIWCLFCKTTIKSSNSYIACKHIFLHLSYENHIDSINEFWKEQRPDKGKWKKEQFYLNKNEINKFLKLSEIVLEESNKKKKKRIQENHQNSKNSQEINNLKKRNIDQNNDIKTNTILNINDLNANDNNVFNNNIINNKIPFRTVKAYGQNLTCISINPTNKIKTNIYDENSVPLWMIDSNSESENNSEDDQLDIKLNINQKINDNPIIGPPINLFLSHKDKERRSKLNPKRLGSTLDRNKKISKNWMPNFGGIWNLGPRSATRKEFLKKFKNKSNQSNKDN